MKTFTFKNLRLSEVNTSEHKKMWKIGNDKFDSWQKAVNHARKSLVNVGDKIVIVGKDRRTIVEKVEVK